MSIKKVLFIFIYFISGLICGFIGIYYFDQLIDLSSFNNYLYVIFLLLLFVYSALFLHLIIHECGHCLFGCLTGYQFISIRFGHFIFIKENEHLHIKKYSLAGTAGQCLLAPPDNDENFPYILYNLGGVLLNIITTSISWMMLLICSSYLCKIFLIIFICMGLFTACINGIPLQTSHIANDGYNALCLKRNKHARKAFWTQMKINEYMSQGYRLKDMPENLFVMPLKEDMQNALCYTIAIFCENRFMDQHQFENAQELIYELFKNIPHIMGIYKHFLINDLIYLYILHNQQHEITQLMDKEHMKIRKTMKKNPSFIRTQYAYELSFGYYEKAQKCLNDFQKLKNSYPYPSDIQSEQELIEIIKNQNYPSKG